MSKESNVGEQLKQGLEELRALRDEIRVKVHLAGADVKTTWSKLEPRLADIEHEIQREGKDAARAASALVDDLKRAFRDFRDRLRD